MNVCCDRTNKRSITRGLCYLAANVLSEICRQTLVIFLVQDLTSRSWSWLPVIDICNMNTNNQYLLGSCMSICTLPELESLRGGLLLCLILLWDTLESLCTWGPDLILPKSLRVLRWSNLVDVFEQRILSSVPTTVILFHQLANSDRARSRIPRRLPHIVRFDCIIW